MIFKPDNDQIMVPETCSSVLFFLLLLSPVIRRSLQSMCFDFFPFYSKWGQWAPGITLCERSWSMSHCNYKTTTLKSFVCFEFFSVSKLWKKHWLLAPACRWCFVICNWKLSWGWWSRTKIETKPVRDPGEEQDLTWTATQQILQLSNPCHRFNLHVYGHMQINGMEWMEFSPWGIRAVSKMKSKKVFQD